MEEKRPLALSILSGLFAFTGLATAAFWIMFFAGKMQATENEQDEAYEKAFPLADSWMIAWALTASVNILRMKKRGLFAGAAAASALVFLGLIDVCYSLQNSKYWPLNSDRAQMLLIHLWAVTFGIVALCFLWKHRDAFED